MRVLSLGAGVQSSTLLLIGLLWLIKRAGDDVRDGEDGL